MIFRQKVIKENPESRDLIKSQNFQGINFQGSGKIRKNSKICCPPKKAPKFPAIRHIKAFATLYALQAKMIKAHHC